MTFRHGGITLGILLVVLLAGCESTPTSDDAYVFSSFRGNGEGGLHLAYSHDGLTWKALKNDTTFLEPEVGQGLMRDPCIIQGPDGTFHMVCTTG